MSQPEARIGKRIADHVKSVGGFVFKVHGGPSMMAGLPDLVCCIQGLFFGIEVKQPGKNAEPRQVYVHGLIRKAGGTVIVAHNVEEAAAGIEALFVAHDLEVD